MVFKQAARNLSGKIRRKVANSVNLTLERWHDRRWLPSAPNPVLNEALGSSATTPSDISDHVGTLFYEAVSTRPRLIVELGTRGGVSTRALLAAAEISDAHVLSIDIDECSNINFPDRFRRRWTFIRADDVAFAGEPFATFCATRGIPPVADVILIDTSHLFEHTRAEIKSWIPRLADRGVVMFHDTNMGVYRRLDGEFALGWDNQRGVIKAIEEFLGRSYAEQTFFADVTGGFAITHLPWSSGLLVMRKLGNLQVQAV